MVSRPRRSHFRSLLLEVLNLLKGLLPLLESLLPLLESLLGHSIQLL